MVQTSGPVPPLKTRQDVEQLVRVMQWMLGFYSQSPNSTKEIDYARSLFAERPRDRETFDRYDAIILGRSRSIPRSV